MNNYRVIFFPRLGVESEFVKECKSMDEAILITEAIGDYTLFLHEQRFMTDFSNYAVIQEFINNKWTNTEK